MGTKRSTPARFSPRPIVFGAYWRKGAKTERHHLSRDANAERAVPAGIHNPPVVELALSVLHEPLVDLKTVHLGLLWSGFKDRYPVIEDQSPVAPQIETENLRIRGKQSGLQLHRLDVPEGRTWFLNAGGSELIQIQKDRFGHNWRKATPSDSYPHYGAIRSRFVEELEVYGQFLETFSLGRLVPTQCEITYVNHFRRDGGWNHADVSTAMRVWSEAVPEFLHDLEDVRFQIRYAIRDEGRRFIGRLHAALQPAWLRETDEQILVLTLTARGAPQGEGLGGCLAFMDIGHEWIVRGFIDLTTDVMQRLWGRTR